MKDSSKPTLKPCPFCGGETVKPYEDGHWWHVSCVGVDGCSARNGNFRSRLDAITAWNTRTATPSDGEGASPPVNAGDKWIERWNGSEPMRGSSIWTQDSIGCHKNMIEHFGGDEETHRSVQRIVAAHNATLSTDSKIASLAPPEGLAGELAWHLNVNDVEERGPDAVLEMPVELLKRILTALTTTARDDVLEEAAKVADHFHFGPERNDRDNARNSIALIIASKIRALKGVPQP